MSKPIEFPGEDRSNEARRVVAECEPVALRTYTPTQAVFAKSGGVFHWTPEGRKLFDFSSGVLVANLGHNPRRWMRQFGQYMGWSPDLFDTPTVTPHEYFTAVTLTAYNGITSVEIQAVQRLLANLKKSSGSDRLNTIVWAASGSEAVHKALWASVSRNPGRNLILATRFGFHGKKGLANAVTGSEKDAERDSRVKFFGFPMDEIADAGFDPDSVDLKKYRHELDELWQQHGQQISCLITEPYLGGGGSFHPPAAYHQMLQQFCREHDILFIFDEVQANFGRTGRMYAFEAYGVEPDMVVLGKGLGNGVPVAAVASRSDIFATMKFGEASDTWSANPLSCAAVLATLDEFESTDVLAHTRTLTPVFLKGLNRLKSTGLIGHVRGEGLVFGIECVSTGNLTANEVAAKIVESGYIGNGVTGIHLLGALAGKVLRVSPPLTITLDQANESLELLCELVMKLANVIR